MPALLQEDLRWCVYRLKESVRNALKGNPNQLFVAGGFVRSCVSGDKINDIDIFAPNRELAEREARNIARAEAKRIHESGNAFTIKTMPYATQFIHRWTFTNPVDCIQSFDFTIAKAAIWWNGTEWESACDERFYPDLAAKRLTYCSPIRDEEAGGSMLRVLKFYQRGFKIDMDSLGAVITRIANSAMDMIPEGETSDSVDLCPTITGLLKEVDPDIDPEHRSHLPGQPSASQELMNLLAAEATIGPTYDPIACSWDSPVVLPSDTININAPRQFGEPQQG